MPTQDDRASAFIVRVWHEQSDAGDDGLRGSVEHIQTGKRIFFTKLDQMREFVAEHVNRAVLPADDSPD